MEAIHLAKKLDKFIMSRNHVIEIVKSHIVEGKEANVISALVTHPRDEKHTDKVQERYLKLDAVGRHLTYIEVASLDRIDQLSQALESLASKEDESKLGHY